MKKVFSISLALLMLLAMVHLTVATHYCGGNFVAFKVSLNGSLASCGMEKCMEKNYPARESHIFTHCCDDVVIFYSTDSNYTPSFSFVPKFYQYNFQVFSIPAGSPVYPIAVLKSLFTNVSPPDASMSTKVDLCDICIFRI